MGDSTRGSQIYECVLLFNSLDVILVSGRGVPLRTSQGQGQARESESSRRCGRAPCKWVAILRGLLAALHNLPGAATPRPAAGTALSEGGRAAPHGSGGAGCQPHPQLRLRFLQLEGLSCLTLVPANTPTGVGPGVANGKGQGDLDKGLTLRRISKTRGSREETSPMGTKPLHLGPGPWVRNGRDGPLGEPLGWPFPLA